jgi:hypothetical protein
LKQADLHKQLPDSAHVHLFCDLIHRPSLTR